MFKFKTNCETFYDHKGRPVRKPEGAPVLWRLGAYALISKGSRFLMVDTVCAPGLWNLPGGGIEPHESIFDGLRRECLEEVGMHIQLVDSAPPIAFSELAFYYQWTNEFMHAIVHVFEARLSERAMSESLPVSPDPSEIIRIAWVDPAEIDETSCHHVHWPLIQRLKR